MTGNTTGAPTGRSRARRNVIGRSPNREEYERLLVGGWSSFALERYAAHRYGEEIPASTFRAYKARKGLAAEVSTLAKNADTDSMIDVIALRADMIRLQQSRIAIDVQHEQQMTKLFGSTKGEIALLDAMLSSHKADLQDLGLMPKAGDMLTIRTPGPTPESAPRKRTLADLLGQPEMTTEQGIEVAKVLHLVSKAGSNGHANGNGNGATSSNGHATG